MPIRADAEQLEVDPAGRLDGRLVLGSRGGKVGGRAVRGADAGEADAVGEDPPDDRLVRLWMIGTKTDVLVEAEAPHGGERHFARVVPAGELGLPTVWINRLDERFDTAPTRELPDLRRLPEVLDELVPG